MSTGWDGRVALTTGATRGLGWATAVALGARGAHVIAVARTVGGLEELDDAVRSAGGPAPTLVPLDITDGEGVDRLGAALFERHGRLDALVHCAAEGAALTPIAHVQPDRIEKLFAVNVLATHRLLRSMDLLLRQAPAPIAALPTDAARVGKAHWGSYSASKAAQEAVFRAFAAETKALRALFFTPPPMPTALRGRTHPGEDRAALTPTADVAAALVAEMDAALAAPAPSTE